MFHIGYTFQSDIVKVLWQSFDIHINYLLFGKVSFLVVFCGVVASKGGAKECLLLLLSSSYSFILMVLREWIVGWSGSVLGGCEAMTIKS